MNIAMEQTEEYVNGQLKNKYGDAFIRGNNGKCIAANLSASSCVAILPPANNSSLALPPANNFIGVLLPRQFCTLAPRTANSTLALHAGSGPDSGTQSSPLGQLLQCNTLLWL